MAKYVPTPTGANTRGPGTAGTTPLDLTAVPCLPGFTLPQHKEKNNKMQRWGYAGGQRVEFDEGYTHDRPRFVQVPKPPNQWRNGEELPLSTTRAIFNTAEKEYDNLPAWEALDKQVLRFYGYYKEPVDESGLENWRVRRCVFFYYLEDDTVHIGEPKVDNSGIPQGVLVRRHRIPYSDKTGRYFTPKDLRIGRPITVYGKTFMVTDCDHFTRAYYIHEGIPQPESMPMQGDPVLEKRLFLDKRSPHMPITYEKRYREVQLGGGHINANMQQFLELDGKVCRFYAMMDDVTTPIFERRPFVILYFLADNSVEIREMYPNNCGRDSFPIFFRRRKLPRDKMDFGSPMATMPKAEDYVKVTDFLVGKTMKLLKFEFHIFDADEFTRRYFREELGVELQPRIQMDLPQQPWPRRPTPPPTGYGTQEDSLACVKSLLPKPPRKDLQKMMDNDGVILRFTAKLRDPKPEDREREFVIAFYLSDDTLMIHEPPKRNSGIVQGRFLQRGKYFNEATGKNFGPRDFQEGDGVKVSGYWFDVKGMDTYTRKWLDEEPPPYPNTDVTSVVEKLREGVKNQRPLVRDMFRLFDQDKNGVVTFEEFKKGMQKFAFNLPDEEIQAVMRHFDLNQDGKVTYTEFCDVLLDKDWSSEMLHTHTKFPVRTTPDEQYADKVQQSTADLKEAQKTRSAVRQIQSVFYAHNKTLTKLLKEFVMMTTKKHVTSQQVQQAMKNIGYEFPLDDVERCITFVQPQADLTQIDYVTFLQGLSVSFHDLPANR